MEGSDLSAELLCIGPGLKLSDPARWVEPALSKSVIGLDPCAYHQA
jgi:hypothetical protein